MRRQRHFVSGLVAFVVTAIVVVGLNGLAGLASAEAGGGGSSPHVECAPFTNYWKLDMPSSVESNVAGDAVVYDLDDLRFAYSVRSDLVVAKIVVKGGQSSTVHSDSGVLQLPSNVSHVTFCFEAPQATTTTTAPPETTTTTAPPETTTTTAPPETTTTTTVPDAGCPAGWGEVLPHQTAQVTVELSEAGTWVLTGHGSNENESANEGELWFVGYGTFPAPTTAALVYDLGEVTVDAPTTLTIVVRPVGRLSVCVSVSAELVTATTTTTAPPETTTTTAPPETTTTTAPPETTTTTAPPETTTTTAPPAIGAALGALCDNDTPWLSYDVDLNGLGEEATVRFANAGGSAEYRVPAGSGRLLWPGAVLDSAGNPIDWPGWDQDADGGWFLNPDNPFIWARQPVSVTIEVGSSVADTAFLPLAADDAGYGPVTIEYPPATSGCTANPSTDQPVTTTTQPQHTTTTVASGAEQPETLPFTGLSTTLFAGIGAAALALGSALVGFSRRRDS